MIMKRDEQCRRNQCDRFKRLTEAVQEKEARLEKRTELNARGQRRYIPGK